MTTANIVAGERATYMADAFTDVLRDYWGTPSPWQAPAEHLDAVIAYRQVADAWGDADATGSDEDRGRHYDLTGKMRGTAWTSAYEDGQGYIVLANLIEIDYPPCRHHFNSDGMQVAEVAEVFAIYKLSEDRQHAEPLDEWAGQLQNDLTSDCIYLLQPVRPDIVIKQRTWTKTEVGWLSSPDASGAFWIRVSDEKLAPEFKKELLGLV